MFGFRGLLEYLFGWLGAVPVADPTGACATLYDAPIATATLYDAPIATATLTMTDCD